MGIITSAIYFGLTLGPLTGGVVATWFGWRWFLVLILFPGMVVWFMLRKLIRQEWREAVGEPFDACGATLLLLGVSMITMGLSCYGIMPGLLWLAPPGIAVIGLFLLKERRTPYPIIDTRMFRQSKGFSTGLLSVLVNYGATMGMVFLFSIYLQAVRGFSPFFAGMILMMQSGQIRNDLLMNA